MHPEIILFDEVTASLDPEMVREVLELINDLAQEGRTMILVTHEMQFAQALLDGRGDAFSTDNTEVLAWALENKGFEVGITSLGDPDTIAAAVQKGNQELLDFINKDIEKLGKENFFHKAYEKTLHPTYGDAAKADDLVVEGGKVD
ncbi:AAA family ATPase [Streptococcus pneumoniae]|uniref:AAA family ATPase n=1 Tax=Streptococcus pneumoniae TaxID=1313 RepID=UPI0021E567F2|nr:transporter substrate-binding domain-containing protein [Streptococcus pneumoniae]